MSDQTYCGFVAIVGRPNVGKSTLLNTIMGEKVSITSFRSQTTRHQILAIKTSANKQIVYVDTPGIHFNIKKALNKEMNKAAHAALEGVDGVVFVVEALKWTQEDKYIAAKLVEQQAPVIIAVNKVDTVKDKTQLLSFMAQLNQAIPNATIIPISATKKIQIDNIEKIVQEWLPESPFHYPQEQKYHQSEEFYVSEIIREKIMRLLEREVPYSTTVQIELMEAREHILHIHALIWVERDGQRKIVIGEKGQVLKEVGTQARIDLERHFNQKVCLKLWIKVKENWSESATLLQQMVYG